MIRKTPIIDSPLKVGDIARAMVRMGDAYVFPEFEEAMSCRAGGRYIYLTNSGVSAFYIILKALSVDSRKTEVVLPAYTAGSLVTAVRKAGLQSVLCDISLKDFNSDVDALLRTVSDKTLAVLCVHSFGVTMNGVAGLKEKLPPDVTVIEDCCQAMGSAIGGTLVGSFGDVAFFSFNRGKNLSLCGGGCVTTDNPKLSETMAQAIKGLTGGKRSFNLAKLFKSMALLIALNPYVYGACYALVSRFKETSPPLDFAIASIDGFQAAMGARLLRRFDAMTLKRHENGMYLIDRLKGQPEIILPAAEGSYRLAFNRFPVVFKDRAARERAFEQLWRAEIESSRMYLRPLHHMFDLGYDKGDFPNACYLADRLLTLPSHPAIGANELSRAVDAIIGALR